MFPIADWRGRVIAFGGRALDKDVSAKYLNSPETPLFHKGATLYNIASARKAAHEGARVVAVEGYIDAIAMVIAGYEATVAPLGTALTADQLALMWRMADEPILCFDGDDAGRRAAYRALDLALPLIKPGKSLKLAALPDGQDPDDLVRSGGREAVEDVLAAARPLADVLWTRESEAGPFNTPERRAALGGAPRRSDGDHRRRDGAPLLPAGFCRAAAPNVYAGRHRLAPPQLGGAGPPPRPGSPNHSAPRHVPPRRALCGREPAAHGEPAASRPSRGDPAPGSVDPASRAQPPLASARPVGGIGRSRIPPRRCAQAQSGPDRRPRPSVRPRIEPRIGPRIARRSGQSPAKPRTSTARNSSPSSRAAALATF